MAIRSSAAHAIFQFMRRIQADVAETDNKEDDISCANIELIHKILIPTFKNGLKVLDVPKEVRRAQMGLLDNLISFFPKLFPDLWNLASMWTYH